MAARNSWCQKIYCLKQSLLLNFKLTTHARAKPEPKNKNILKVGIFIEILLEKADAKYDP